MDSWLKLLYPGLQVTDKNLAWQNPPPSSAPMIAPLPEMNNGFYFGGGGINYSHPIWDGQFNGQLKANQLNLNWLDQLNKLQLQARPNGDWNINYKHSF